VDGRDEFGQRERTHGRTGPLGCLSKRRKGHRLWEIAPSKGVIRQSKSVGNAWRSPWRAALRAAIRPGAGKNPKSGYLERACVETSNQGVTVGSKEPWFEIVDTLPQFNELP
jgi:hypothetical protein